MYGTVLQVPERAQERGAVSKFLSEHWGDLASVVGFVVTIVLLLVSTSAARAAKQAAERTAWQVRWNLALSDVTAAISLVERTMALQRQGRWEDALDRYAMLKRLVVRIREEGPSFRGDRLKTVQTVINQITQARNRLEKELAEGPEQPDVVKYNRTLDKQLERLESIAVSVKLLQGD